MDALKLVALDDQDLTIVSAHVQDAVVKSGELRFDARARRFIVPMRRFAWETQEKGGTPERRNTVLHFDRVTGARATGIAKAGGEDVLALLAITFEGGDAPAGTVTLTFAGNAALKLDVECIEARLTDLGGAWQAGSRPDHEL